VSRLLAASSAFFLFVTPLLAQTAAQTTADAVLPISPAVCAHMKQHHVLNPGAPVPCERLRLLKFGYVGFDGQTRDDAEMVVMDAVADHVLAVFVALRAKRFPIASVKLMDHFEGNDEASTARNNTSSLNVRQIAGGGPISLHSYGVAIDLNPLQNPYITYTTPHPEEGARDGVRPSRRISIDPPAATDYVRRTPLRPGMAEDVVALFAAHGFAEWGGRWKNPIDYQHFQVGRALADRLARLAAAQARALFEQSIAGR
jgi:hypothetical protein